MPTTHSRVLSSLAPEIIDELVTCQPVKVMVWLKKHNHGFARSIMDQMEAATTQREMASTLLKALASQSDGLDLLSRFFEDSSRTYIVHVLRTSYQRTCYDVSIASLTHGVELLSVTHRSDASEQSCASTSTHVDNLIPLPSIIVPMWTFMAGRPWLKVLNEEVIKTLIESLKKLYADILPFVHFPPCCYKRHKHVRDVFVAPKLFVADEPLCSSSDVSVFIAAVQRSSPVAVLCGEEGCGKTTITKKICYDWARSPQDAAYDLVLIVYLRDCVALPAEYRLVDVVLWWLTQFVENLQCEDIRHHLIALIMCRSVKTLFILDGLDEAAEELLENVFHFLWTDDIAVYPFDILVTARRCDALNRVHCVHKRVQVAGFDLPTQVKFVEHIYHKIGSITQSSISSRPARKQHKLPYEVGIVRLRRLIENDIWWHLTKVPLLLCIFSWAVCREIIVRTNGVDKLEMFREICKALTISYVSQLVCMTNESMYSHENSELFYKLGKMAYELLLDDSNRYIDEDMLRKYDLYLKMNVLLETGMLTNVCSMQETHLEFSSQRYKFVHTAFQEYFAGIYLSLDARGSLILAAQLTKHFGAFRLLKPVIMFYFGLAKESISVAQDVIQRLKHDSPYFRSDTLIDLLTKMLHFTRNSDVYAYFKDQLIFQLSLPNSNINKVSFNRFRNVVGELTALSGPATVGRLTYLDSETFVCLTADETMLLSKAKVMQNCHIQYIQKNDITMIWHYGNAHDTQLFLPSFVKPNDGSVKHLRSLRLDIGGDFSWHIVNPKFDMSCENLIINYGHITFDSNQCIDRSLLLMLTYLTSCFQTVNKLVLANCWLVVGIADLLSIIPDSLSELHLHEVCLKSQSSLTKPNSTSNVKILSFRNCTFDTPCITIAVCMSPNIEKLLIYECSQTYGFGGKCLHALAKSINASPQLHSLVICDAPELGKNINSMKAFCSGFAVVENQSITHISLHNCGLNDAHLDLILDLLPKFQHLCYLSLLGSTFSALSAQKLILLCRTHVVTLDFG